MSILAHGNELVITDGIVMKSKWISITFALQTQILDQLHSNHMGIEMMQLFTKESAYWINMNADIENMVK